MAIPSAVRKQGEESERQAKELGMTGAPGTTPEALKPAEQQPAKPPAQSTTAPPPEENWELRYKNLRAERDKRLDALEKRNEELQQLVTDSQQRVNDLLERLETTSDSRQTLQSLKIRQSTPTRHGLPRCRNGSRTSTTNHGSEISLNSPRP